MTLTTHKWARTDYHRMIDLGLLRSEDRVELIRGDIVDMAAHDPMHSNTLDHADSTLKALFAQEFRVRVQLPLIVGRDSEPEPDLCLITQEMAGEIARQARHPDRAELVIEVSSTSLRYDREVKAHLYAEAQVPEYWILNLPDRVLECHRLPLAGRYTQTDVLQLDGTVEFRGRSLSVRDLFLPTAAIG